MQSVNIHEAKTRFSKLLEEVQKGEEIIIAKAGRPIAKLTAYTPARPKVAPPGSMEGEAWCADDFDEPQATCSSVWKTAHEVAARYTNRIVVADVSQAPSAEGWLRSAPAERQKAASALRALRKFLKPYCEYWPDKPPFGRGDGRESPPSISQNDCAFR